MLAKLLADATTMPVVEATDGMMLAAGRVYVIPPNTFLSVSDGALRLTPRPADRASTCPSTTSSAPWPSTPRAGAAGVVLSGSDADGSAGLREIKAVGGITFAQDAGDRQVRRHAPRRRSPPGVGGPGPAAGGRSPRSWGGSPATRCCATGTGRRRRRRRGARIQERAAGSGSSPCCAAAAAWTSPTTSSRPSAAASSAAWCCTRSPASSSTSSFLQQNPAEVHGLYQDILIHVTRFFREPEAFEALTRAGLPAAPAPAATAEQPVRIWVPGCSTGEEAYSVAIACWSSWATAVDGARRSRSSPPTSARRRWSRRGPASTPRTSPPTCRAERLRRFFTKIDGSYRISKAVRDLCVFARQDLTARPAVLAGST